MNYQELMSHNPTEYQNFNNSVGQRITFVEHPINGEDSSIICVCHKLKISVSSGFYDIYDMIALKDYEPIFKDGKLLFGYEH